MASIFAVDLAPLGQTPEARKRTAHGYRPPATELINGLPIVGPFLFLSWVGTFLGIIFFSLLRFFLSRSSSLTL
jgi:hypothetical protein